ncbi:MAG: glycosyltransferase family 39 protein, partial [Chloroflexi bacterium]|nr:glycosyltransferase family 39 protein [Chloroflexota bacterium]
MERHAASWIELFEHLRAGAFQIDTVVQAVGLCLAAAAILAFVAAAVFRLSYPYQLQVTEPASLGEVERILRGQPLYVEPTLAYVPQIYGPVYFYVSAALARVMGDGYAPMRLVSLLASVGTVLVLGRLVYRETGSRSAALLAGGVYAATFPFGDTTLDLARVDAFFTFLLFVAVYAARRAALEPRQASLSLAISGVVLGLAALTKLPLGAVPVALGIFLSSVFAHRARALVFLAAAGVTVAAGLAL